MWVPYLLSALIIYVTILESIYAFEEAKKREYIKRGFDDAPPSPGRIAKVIAVIAFSVYCLTYVFSAHVTLVCLFVFTAVQWFISWKRYKKYKEISSLMSATIMITLMAISVYHMWDQFPM